jgi:hypothetical protein
MYPNQHLSRKALDFFALTPVLLPLPSAFPSPACPGWGIVVWIVRYCVVSLDEG